MSTGYQITEQNTLHFVTFTIVDWVDLFTRKLYRDIIIDAFNFHIKNRGLDVYGYVIMSNHVHAMLHQPDGNLFDTIRDFRKYTARKIIEAVKQEPESRREWMLENFRKAAAAHPKSGEFKFWQDGYHPVELYSAEFTKQKLNYIHNNPVEELLVQYPWEYMFSSARNYADMDSLLEVIKIS